MCYEGDYIGQGKGGTLDGKKTRKNLGGRIGNGKLKGKLSKKSKKRLQEEKKS
jgi:hypothetical protein